MPRNYLSCCSFWIFQMILIYFINIYHSIYLSIYDFISLLLYLSAYPSITITLSLSTYQSICQSINRYSIAADPVSAIGLVLFRSKGRNRPRGRNCVRRPNVKRRNALNVIANLRQRPRPPGRTRRRPCGGWTRPPSLQIRTEEIIDGSSALKHDLHLRLSIAFCPFFCDLE